MKASCSPRAAVWGRGMCELPQRSGYCDRAKGTLQFVMLRAKFQSTLHKCQASANQDSGCLKQACEHMRPGPHNHVLTQPSLLPTLVSRCHAQLIGTSNSRLGQAKSMPAILNGTHY